MDWNSIRDEYYLPTGELLELPRPKTIYMPEDTEIDKDLITRLITEHREQAIRFTILYDYYLGHAPIQQRVRDLYKPNNRIVSGFPSYIVDILVGMFIGEPPSYSVEEDKERNLDIIQEIFHFNDEQDENYELSKFNSIYGKSYEIVYVDENSLIRFNELDPRNVVYVYDTKLNPDPLFAIHFQGEGDNRVVDVFTREYDIRLEGADLEVTKQEPNLLGGKIKIVESSNNNEKLGDFERVLSEINDYNLKLSDASNDLQEFSDSMLVLGGMLNTESDDIEQMKKDRVILLAENQKAEWLIKTGNKEELEYHLSILNDDIHRFTKIPNLTDEKFSGNSSGVALKYKLLALRQVIAAKERKFKRFLQDRLELIIEYAKWLSLGLDEDFRHYDITIDFNSNIPIDEEANVRMVKDLMDIVSESTAISQLAFIDNANYEIEKKRQEQDVYADSIINYLEEDDEDESETEE